MSVAVVAHCDWSIDPRKRWMCVAVANGQDWTFSAPEPVGDTESLIKRLKARRGQSGALLIGYDFPIGLPSWYGCQTGFASFKQALAAFGSGEWSSWYDVAERPDEISLRRPFYPMRPGGALRAHLAIGLGAPEVKFLTRRCERATADRSAACMLFWTLGGNQVGKAAITGWRDVIVPHLDDIGIWPFDGALHELAATHEVVMAETYPGDVYRRLGIPRNLAWSKRRHDGRARVSPYLKGWLANNRHVDAGTIATEIALGFGDDKTGEDRFDSLVGLMGMLDVVSGHQPEGHVDDDIRNWEGWILGMKP